MAPRDQSVIHRIEDAIKDNDLTSASLNLATLQYRDRLSDINAVLDRTFERGTITKSEAVIALIILYLRNFSNDEFLQQYASALLHSDKLIGPTEWAIRHGVPIT